MYNIQMTKMFNVYTWLFGAIVVNDFSLVGKRAFSHLGKQSYRENHICSLQILESLMYFKERLAYVNCLGWWVIERKQNSSWKVALFPH